MKNQNLTELVFILDRSGSMAGLEGDTIGGFNAMLEKQKKGEGDALVTTVLFDNESKTLHDRRPLEKVKPLTEKDYVPGGCTALLDAVGDAICHITAVHRYIRPEDTPARTMFVITTDGMENASTRFTRDKVKALIEEKQGCGWEFLFIGANIDAVETARTYGIREDRAVKYRADGRGTRVLYNTVAKAVGAVCENRLLQADWCKEIAEDFEEKR